MFRTTPLYTGHRALIIAGFLTIAVGAAHVGLTFLAYRPVLKLTALWFEMLNDWSEPRGYVEIALFSMGVVAALRSGHPVSAAAPAEPGRRP